VKAELYCGRDWAAQVGPLPPMYDPFLFLHPWFSWCYSFNL
jgi:hypothetical protein